LTAYIGDHSDDHALSMGILDNLADRIPIRKIAVRHRLVDHARARSLGAVTLVEEAPRQQRHPHRLEVSGRHGADLGDRIFSTRWRLPLDSKWQG
jgi:hypothetical protein